MVALVERDHTEDPGTKKLLDDGLNANVTLPFLLIWRVREQYSCVWIVQNRIDAWWSVCENRYASKANITPAEIGILRDETSVGM